MATLPSPESLAQAVEFTEAAAYVDMFAAAPRELGFEVEESDQGILLLAPRFDVLMLNRAMAVGMQAPASERFAQSVVDRYRSAKVKNFGVQASPHARPDELDDWFGAAGLDIRDYWSKVFRTPDPEPAVATDLRIERIGSRLADCFAEVACAGFGMPDALRPVMAGPVGRRDWHHYIAWEGDVAAAVAALFVCDSVGWLGVAATLPAYRRRGGQGALMARRIKDGLGLGCRLFVTETGQDRPDKPNPSFHNMLRTGFVVAYHRPNYMLPA
jgi:hypothetical protein